MSRGGSVQTPAASPARLDHDDRGVSLASAALAIAVGCVGGWAASAGSVALVVIVAVLQAGAGIAWLAAADVPGRAGGAVLTACAGAAADVCASVWPHARLGSLVAVLALAVPTMFLHQLTRGAARVRVVASLGGIAVAIATVVAASALLQTRHQFGADAAAVTVSVVGGAAAGLAVAALLDVLIPEPRFDRAAPSGVAGVGGAALAGAAVSALALRSAATLSVPAAVLLGAVVAALAGLLAVGTRFVTVAALRAGEPDVDSPSRLWQPMLYVCLPLALVAPVGFLLASGLSR